VNAPSGRSRGCTCWTAKNRFLCRFRTTSPQPQAADLLAPKGPKQVSPGQSAAAKPRSAALGRSGSSILTARDGISPERAKQGTPVTQGGYHANAPSGRMKPVTHGNVAALQPMAPLRSALGHDVNAPAGQNRGVRLADASCEDGLFLVTLDSLISLVCGAVLRSNAPARRQFLKTAAFGLTGS
jgi:hypothetical protein